MRDVLNESGWAVFARQAAGPGERPRKWHRHSDVFRRRATALRALKAIVDLGPTRFDHWQGQAELRVFRVEVVPVWQASERTARTGERGTALADFSRPSDADPDLDSYINHDRPADEPGNAASGRA